MVSLRFNFLDERRNGVRGRSGSGRQRTANAAFPDYDNSGQDLRWGGPYILGEFADRRLGAELKFDGVADEVQHLNANGSGIDKNALMGPDAATRYIKSAM